jgi:hypothetical protein
MPPRRPPAFETRPLRRYGRLLQLVERPQFERLPEPVKKEVQRELVMRRGEGRAA